MKKKKKKPPVRKKKPQRQPTTFSLLRERMGDAKTLRLINEALKHQAEMKFRSPERVTVVQDMRWRGKRTTGPDTLKLTVGDRVAFGFPSHDRRSKVFEPRDSLNRRIPWLRQGAIGTLKQKIGQPLSSLLIQFDEAPRGGSLASPTLICADYAVPLRDL